MKRKTYLMVGLFLAATLAVGSFSAVTLAWIIRTSAIEGIKVDASSLALNLNNQNLYKYVFPRYKDSSGNETNVVDYLSKGEVKPVSNDSNMNPLDPTYLNIQHMLSQEGISSLNTNLVLEFTFTITYSTSIDLYVFAERDYEKELLKTDPDAQRVSDFIHFDLFNASEIQEYLDDPLESDVFTGDGSTVQFDLTSNPSGIANITVGGVATNEYEVSGKTILFHSPPENHKEIIVNYSTLWHAVKFAAEGNKTDAFKGDGTKTVFATSYAPTSTPTVTVDGVEAEFTYAGQNVTITSAPAANADVKITYPYSRTHDTFPFQENVMTMSDYHLVEDRPLQETTQQYTFYLNIEYDYDIVSSDDIFNFFAPAHLGIKYALDKDYRLVFGVKQGAK